MWTRMIDMWDFTRFDSIVLGFIVVQLGLVSFTWFYWVLLGFTRFYLVFARLRCYVWQSAATGAKSLTVYLSLWTHMKDITSLQFWNLQEGHLRHYSVLLGFTRFCSVLLGSTRFYLVQLSFSRFYPGQLGSTCFNLVLLGFWKCWDNICDNLEPLK
jgi:hypothetical protein